MFPQAQGSLRLFRLLGIDVFLHWSWFVVALYVLSSRADEYSSLVWNAAEYLSLFLIVLMHEFGHSLACRQTGGAANRIVLWPLGGVAYVAPPQRPGAQLWSIAAGPLVNVLLVPFLYGALWLADRQGWAAASPDLADFLVTLNFINAVILVFNLLPVYPLDGGQILRSVLWFFIGPVNSLLAATVLGFVGGLGLVVVGIVSGRLFTAVLAGFLLFNCWGSFRLALAWRAHLAAEARARAQAGEAGPASPPPL
jgi:Zn-dependent protease